MTDARRSRPRVPLSIAGSDPSGGAGLQADMKTFLRFGLSGAGVVTALTVQSPSGVRAVEPIDAKLVRRQLVTLLEDVRPAAVKIGLLPGADVVRAVARTLGPLARRGIPIVIDPVLASSSGRRFLPAEDVATFTRLLMPLATVLTPNLDEAAELAGVDVAEARRDLDPLVRTLLRKGAQNVLVKGGHLRGSESVDVLGTPDEIIMFSAPRVPRRRQVQGTGCMLSSAIAASLALGASLEDAIGQAKQFVTQAIEDARQVGRGARQLDFLAEM